MRSAHHEDGGAAADPQLSEASTLERVMEVWSDQLQRMRAVVKAAELAAIEPPICWHFIGPLQRNKARQASITSEILDIVGGAEAQAMHARGRRARSCAAAARSRALVAHTRRRRLRDSDWNASQNAHARAAFSRAPAMRSP